MLSDEEILGLFRFAGSAFKSAERLDFARAVEAAVLKRTVKTVTKIAEQKVISAFACSSVIDALEGRWQP